jgi:hypothetical protein
MQRRSIRPDRVYGFTEKSRIGAVLDPNFVRKLGLGMFSCISKQNGRDMVGYYDIVYGLLCHSIESMNEIDKATVDKVFESLSRSGDYTVPIVRSLLGEDCDLADYEMYIPEGLEEA